MRAYHNSRLSEYRKPFGAINTGGTVSLSIDLFEESGAEIVLRTWVDGAGEAFYPMTKNPMEDRVRYSCALKCEEAALYWYSFRINRADGTCMYYGAKQGSTGGEGEMYFGNPPSFQITSYKERKLPEPSQPLEQLLPQERPSLLQEPVQLQWLPSTPACPLPPESQFQNVVCDKHSDIFQQQPSS